MTMVLIYSLLTFLSILFIFKNINELVNSINKIINLDSNSYDLMCKESIKRAKENFDIENYVLNMTDKYIKGRLKN